MGVESISIQKMNTKLSLFLVFCILAEISHAGDRRQSRSYGGGGRKGGGSRGGGSRGGGSRGGGGRGGGNKISAGTQCTLVKQQGSRGGGSNCFNEQECGQQCSTVSEQQCSTVSEQQCRNVPSQECSTVNEQQCRGVNEQQCRGVP